MPRVYLSANILAQLRTLEGPFRASEAKRLGLTSVELATLTRRGVLQRLARGVYQFADAPSVGNPDLVTVALRIPRGIICLTSALAFHELTVEIPPVVDVAVLRGTEPPRLTTPPIRSYQISDPAFSAGVERHTIDGMTVKVYAPAKTVADCFKFRNRIGLDIALDALKRYLARPGASVDALMHYARIDRVHRVLHPYLSMLLAGT